MSTLKVQLSNDLVGRTISGVRLYQVNEGHVIIEERRAVALDGGVELVLTDATFCWWFDEEVHDARMTPLKVLSPDLPTYEIDAHDQISAHLIEGNVIEQIEVEAINGEDFEGNPFQQVLELRLTLQNGSTIQIAAVSFDEDVEGADDLIYDPCSQLLVAINRIYPVKHPPDTSD